MRIAWNLDNREQFDKVLKEIAPLTEAVKVYGVYKRGLWNSS